MDDRFWLRERDGSGTQYIVSTRRALLDLGFINHEFSKDELFWATPLALPALQTMLDNSLSLGLYIYNAPTTSDPPLTLDTVASVSHDQLTQIGIGRYITDRVTFAYLCDMFIVSEHQGRGLGKWLGTCCADVLENIKEAGGFRRSLLLTSNTDQAVPIYQKCLGMQYYDQSGAIKLMSTTKEPH